MRIGVISDTHGHYNPRVTALFAGVEHIIHGGDIGNQSIIDRLRSIAPVTAVTGNVDWGGPLDREYRRVQHIELAGYTIYVTHIGDAPGKLIGRLPDPRPDIYIYGHSHIPLVERLEQVLFLNPGAAGQPRFGRSTSIAVLDLGAEPLARIINL